LNQAIITVLQKDLMESGGSVMTLKYREFRNLSMFYSPKRVSHYCFMRKYLIERREKK